MVNSLAFAALKWNCCGITTQRRRLGFNNNLNYRITALHHFSDMHAYNVCFHYDSENLPPATQKKCSIIQNWRELGVTLVRLLRLFQTEFHDVSWDLMLLCKQKPRSTTTIKVFRFWWNLKSWVFGRGPIGSGSQSKPLQLDSWIWLYHLYLHNISRTYLFFSPTTYRFLSRDSAF